MPLWTKKCLRHFLERMQHWKPAAISLLLQTTSGHQSCQQTIRIALNRINPSQKFGPGTIAFMLQLSPVWRSVFSSVQQTWAILSEMAAPRHSGSGVQVSALWCTYQCVTYYTALITWGIIPSPSLRDNFHRAHFVICLASSSQLWVQYRPLSSCWRPFRRSVSWCEKEG